MLRFLPAAAWSAGAIGLALCCVTYGRTIAAAPNARTAAPLAAPLLLCGAGAAGMIALAGASAADAAARKRNIF